MTSQDSSDFCFHGSFDFLSSAGLEVFGSRGCRRGGGSDVAPVKNHNKYFIELEIKTSPQDHFGLLMPLIQMVKGITVRRGNIDPDYRGKIGFLSHNGNKNTMS